MRVLLLFFCALACTRLAGDDATSLATEGHSAPLSVHDMLSARSVPLICDEVVITSTDAEVISTYLQRRPSPLALRFVSTQPDERGSRLLASLRNTHSVTVEGGSVGTQLGEAFVVGLSKMPSLRKLRLDCQEPDAEPVTASRAIASIRTLEALHIAFEIEDVGGMASLLPQLGLLEVRGLYDRDALQLRACRRLNTLVASDCELSSEGFKAICGMDTLRKLSLKGVNWGLLNLDPSALKALTTLRGLSDLELGTVTGLVAEDFETLAACAALATLKLSDCEGLDDDAVRLICRSKSLQDVSLAGPLTNAAIAHLGSRRLARLDLSGCPGINPADISKLYGDSLTEFVPPVHWDMSSVDTRRVLLQLKGLRRVVLQGELSPTDVAELQKFQMLEVLDLAGASFANHACIKSLPAPPTLRALALNLKGASAASCQPFFEVLAVTPIESISLSGLPLPTVKQMTAPSFERLRSLEVRDAAMSRATILALRACPSLRRLHFERCSFDAEVTLEALSALAHLSDLKLADCTGISPAAMLGLAGLRFLTSLDLTRLALSESHVAAIAKIGALRFLNIAGTGLSAEDTVTLERALPLCLIWG